MNADKKEFFRHYAKLFTDNDVLSRVHSVSTGNGRVNLTESKNFLVIVVIVSLIAGTIVVLPFLTNPIGTDNQGNWNQPTSQVQYLTVHGNTTDIIYPELMEAVFELQSSGEYNASAHFVDDSGIPFKIYDLSFIATQAEIVSIIDVLYTGLKDTIQSNDSIDTITDQGSMGFGIDVKFTDGIWVEIFTIQSIKGHITFLNGTYEGDVKYRDTNLVLEPASALDPLALVLNSIFTEHLD